jgi:DNA-binding MarR family transcriptional regulator
MSHQPLKLGSFLPFRLSLASNLVSQRIAETYEEDFGLSMTQWRGMAVLGERPGLSASELVKLTALDKVAVSRAVSRLEERGLVEKAASTNDGRRFALSLTKSGLGVYGEVIPRARALEEDLRRTLTGELEDALERALDRMIEAASA